MPPPRSMDNDKIPASVFAALTAQEDRHMRSLEEVRKHLTEQIDELHDMLQCGASKEELNEKITEVRAEIGSVRGDVNDVRTLIKELQAMFQGMQNTLVQKQKEGYIRVIAIQASILTPVAASIIIYILEQLLGKR